MSTMELKAQTDTNENKWNCGAVAFSCAFEQLLNTNIIRLFTNDFNNVISPAHMRKIVVGRPAVAGSVNNSDYVGWRILHIIIADRCNRAVVLVEIPLVRASSATVIRGHIDWRARLVTAFTFKFLFCWIGKFWICFVFSTE